jgi:hypothetical protein
MFFEKTRSTSSVDAILSVSASELKEERYIFSSTKESPSGRWDYVMVFDVKEKVHLAAETKAKLEKYGLVVSVSYLISSG